MRGRQVFFEQELDTVGRRLEQAKWSDPRGAPTVLHMADHFALQPYGIRDRGEQDEQHQRNLDDRNDDEGEYAQLASFN